MSLLHQFPCLAAYLADMQPIPAGEFTMGSNRFADEKPAHLVRLSGFGMGSTPATVGMWQEYCSATSTEMPEEPDWGWLDGHPMVNVSWNAIAGSDGTGGFCAWASEVSGVTLTLPTESQWEYAARGGQECKEYPWGDGFDASKLWCSVGESRSGTAPVVRSSNVYRNGYGLSDMAGNVWEWCLDWYGPYLDGAQTDPMGSAVGDSRVLRGGSWDFKYPVYFRCALRGRGTPDNRNNDDGFRLVSPGP